MKGLRAAAHLYTLLCSVANFSITTETHRIVVTKKGFALWNVLVLLPDPAEEYVAATLVSCQHFTSFDALVEWLNNVA